MKILLISSNSGSRGGGEIYLLRLAEGLAVLGHEVHLLFSTAANMDELASLVPRGISVHRIPYVNMYARPTRILGSVFDRYQQDRLALKIFKLQPDIIHVNQQLAEDALDILLAADRTATPVFSTIHITHSNQALGARFGRLRDRMTKRVFAGVSVHHITVSDHGMRTLVGWMPDLTKQGRVVPIYLGVGTQKRMKESERTAIRSQWGIGPDETVLGTVGQLAAQRNPLFALDLVAWLKAAGEKVRWVWIGEGDMRDEFMKQAKRLDIADQVVIDGWHHDASRRLGALDIFALPSHQEGHPLALLEAMQMALPCVVSRETGIDEVVQEGETGFLCDLEDPARWMDSLSALVADEALRRRLGKAGKKRAKAEFSLAVMAQRTARYYELVISGKIFTGGKNPLEE